VNTSQCIGHGACFQACPTQAISLFIGTEKRGVDLPNIDKTFETNVPGIYIAGELGGMGLIRNATEQGKQATQNIVSTLDKNHGADYDLIIVGSGPAGIAGALTAKMLKIKAVVLEQESLGGTVFTYPRSKVIMTAPMDLPLYGKLKLYQTSKTELLTLWKTIIAKHSIDVKEFTKVEAIAKEGNNFSIKTKNDEVFTSNKVLLALGRRGTPRKLNIPGEGMEKVAYRLLEPEAINDKDIIVVGGGDAGVESALMLMDQNRITLINREENFSRCKPANREKILGAQEKGIVDNKLLAGLLSIEEGFATVELESKETVRIKNDLVFIFAGGEMPFQFLEKCGIEMTKSFGTALLKH